MPSNLRSIGKFYQLYTNKIFTTQIRRLNLLECHSKVLLQNHGINVQKFVIIENPLEANDLQSKFKVDEYVIKAQILAGGRGLGYFDNGFKGGVHITKDPNQVLPIVEKMIGHKLITKQTPKTGIEVKKIMIAESVPIKRETYLSIVMDRFFNGPVMIASPAGGTDIENVAKKTPHLIKTFPVDIEKGVTQELSKEVAAFLQFQGSLNDKAALEIKRLYELFLHVDATQVEINPLVETENGQGDIGCMVNGAGLAMATMDIIKLHGGEPANFLDVGGGVNENQVHKAFEILTSDPNVKSILVNVFGGIVNCGTIASGIINATKSLSLKVPLVVRLEGTNVEAAQKLLKESGLPIVFANDFEEAAQKVVASLGGNTKKVARGSS
ncbi:hypothetical protein O3M35_012733 [Rhynocoris fuscipes]|uniref:Succinyl-CoA synthetase beta chain n=1 Tax=Rhynocoris fuscipes TaxID=488301 RepID=A0AAW1CTF1_9HEMI